MYRKKVNLLLLLLYSVCVYSAHISNTSSENAADNEHIHSDSNNSDKEVETSTILENILNLGTTDSVEKVDECSCGSNSFGCVNIWDNKKLCRCSPFYAQFREKCLECNCGPNAFDCVFDTVGDTVCDCRPGYAQKDGECIECSCGEHSSNCLFDWRGNQICKCSPGYAQRNGKCSETCKRDRDCSPGQKCLKEGDGYFCGCRANYTGKECETHELCIDLEPRCKNMGAACLIDIDGQLICRCPPGKTVGFPSGLCEDTCNPERCLHGKCLDIGRGFYHCECDKGYTGRRCEEKVDTDNRHLIIAILAVLGVATAVSIVGNLYFICRKKT